MSIVRAFEGDTWSLTEDGKTLLAIRETKNDNEVTISLSGSLRSDTEHFVKDELGALATVGMDVVVDCRELNYISNSCLLALLTVQQEMDQWKKGSLTICNVPEKIYSEMKEIHLHELLAIE